MTIDFNKGREQPAFFEQDFRMIKQIHSVEHDGFLAMGLQFHTGEIYKIPLGLKNNIARRMLDGKPICISTILCVSMN